MVESGKNESSSGANERTHRRIQSVPAPMSKRSMSMARRRYTTNSIGLGSPLSEEDDPWNAERHYDWHNYFRGEGTVTFVRWLATGNDGLADAALTDQEIGDNLRGLARMITLLRKYHEVFGVPEEGGSKDAEFVLREVVKDLYAGGAPIWALENAMGLAAQGLVGRRCDFFLLPRKGFIFAPSSGATVMFRIARGFDIQLLNASERIMVRLASFASNTMGVASMLTRKPTKEEMRGAARDELQSAGEIEDMSREEMADEILNLASWSEGLFFSLNSSNRPDIRAEGGASGAFPRNEDPLPTDRDEFDSFWCIEQHLCDIFSRLAAMEAIGRIKKIDEERKPNYGKLLIAIFRFVSSAGASGFWFGGGHYDMLVAGACGVVVGLIATSQIFTREERILFETLASFATGLIAGLAVLTGPEHTCFRAIAVAGVLDILQGFRVVYSVIEVMSKHTVTGAADFLEGMLYTGLIASFLSLGLSVAAAVYGVSSTREILDTQCSTGISKWWYFVLVPTSSVSWSGLFNPGYKDLPLMAAHGVLAFVVSMAINETSTVADLSLFVGALAVTFSAGLISRFNGRSAIGNTVAGLYVLLPGAYLVNSLFSTQALDFLGKVFVQAALIGIGAWSGTLLCSPTLMGASQGFLQHMHTQWSNSGFVHATGSVRLSRETSVRKNGTGAMLFF